MCPVPSNRLTKKVNRAPVGIVGKTPILFAELFAELLAELFADASGFAFAPGVEAFAGTFVVAPPAVVASRMIVRVRGVESTKGGLDSRVLVVASRVAPPHPPRVIEPTMVAGSTAALTNERAGGNRFFMIRHCTQSGRMHEVFENSPDNPPPVA